MDHFGDARKRARLTLLLLCALFFSAGCATTEHKQTGQLPPILAQDELLRPYQKVASIEVRRSRYGSPSDFSPADYDWAYQALRLEGDRIGADAVITPELRVELKRYLFYPVSRMKARGIAIKFQ